MTRMWWIYTSFLEPKKNWFSLKVSFTIVIRQYLLNLAIEPITILFNILYIIYLVFKLVLQSQVSLFLHGKNVLKLLILTMLELLSINRLPNQSKIDKRSTYLIRMELITPSLTNNPTSLYLELSFLVCQWSPYTSAPCINYSWFGDARFAPDTNCILS